MTKTNSKTNKHIKTNETDYNSDCESDYETDHVEYIPKHNEENEDAPRQTVCSILL